MEKAENIYVAKIVLDKKDCCWGEQLPDGRIIVVYLGPNANYFLAYNVPFLLDGKITTLNDLNKSVGTTTIHCYDEYTICPQGEIDFNKIVDEFIEHGFNVSKKAIEHNYESWCNDLKSGFRDDENGYHLFTPCGCNKLRFSATTLHDNCRDWQITYCC